MLRMHLELNLARDVKGEKKGVYRLIGSKRKARENVGLALKGQRTWCQRTWRRPVCSMPSLLHSLLVKSAFRLMPGP